MATSPAFEAIETVFDSAIAPDPSAHPVQRSLDRNLSASLSSAGELLRDRAPAAVTIPTAVDAIDRLLLGGLARGHLIEIVGRKSCGRYSTLLSALAAVTRRGEPAVLVDLGNALDPAIGAAIGIDLEQLLWIRPRHMKEALVGVETVLSTGFPLVVLDLGHPPVRGGRGAAAAWVRLARTAQARQAAVLVSSPYRVSGTAATAVLEAGPARPVWHGRGSTPKLLSGLYCRVTLKKMRGRQGGDNRAFNLDMPMAAIYAASPDSSDSSDSPDPFDPTDLHTERHRPEPQSKQSRQRNRVAT